jgi:hypothetical protein
LATQHWINLMLSAIEAGITNQLLVPPAVAFADLRAVGGWLLRGAVEEDIGQFGPYAERAWQAFCKRTPSRPFLDPPRAAALIGAVATIARALITRDDDDAIERLRSLLGRSGRSKLRARGLTLDQWQQLSDPVRGRFLRAIDHNLATVAWIRYCLGIPEARIQITGGDPPAIARTTDGPVPAETGLLLSAPTSLASFRP